MEEIQADVVIVGAGTAGCVLATRLAEYGFEVLLLSSGSNDTTNPLVKRTSQFVELLKMPQFKHNLFHTPLSNLNGRTLELIVWNTLGGNSINWGGMERMSKNECDLFVDATGDSSFNFEHMSTYYKMVEKFTTLEQSSKTNHDTNNGKIPMVHSSSPPFSEIWKKVADELGETFTNDLTGPITYGFSFESSSFVDGVRHWSASDYLIPAMNKYPNLSVRTDATVTKFDVNAKTKHVDSLLFVSSKGYFRVMARKEYILSAGTFFSPQLLLVSGIGDPELLQQNNIDVKHVLTQVGKNLTDNGLVPMEYEMKGLPTNQCIPIGLVNRRTKTTETNSDLFFVLRMSQPTENIRVLTFNCQPKSPSGSISLYNSNPLMPPKITLNYLEHEEDIEAFVDSISYIRRVMFTNAIQETVEVTEILPGIHEVDLHSYIRDKFEPAYHFIGTCAMGQDPQTSVVNKDFKVHGIDNLRVVDASVFPKDFVSLKGPCLPVYALAEKAADHLRKEYFR